MILPRDLKGATWLDRSTDVSVHVSTWTSYDFKALTPVVVLIRQCFYVSSQNQWSACWCVLQSL